MDAFVKGAIRTSNRSPGSPSIDAETLAYAGPILIKILERCSIRNVTVSPSKHEATSTPSTKTKHLWIINCVFQTRKRIFTSFFMAAIGAPHLGQLSALSEISAVQSGQEISGILPFVEVVTRERLVSAIKKVKNFRTPVVDQSAHFLTETRGLKELLYLFG
jgi:hypothetical protein